MRKYISFLLTVLLLCPFSASAAARPQYIGLAFRGFPAGEGGRTLLDGLAQREARATFFLDAPSREQGQRILDGGHDIGLTAPESWNPLSRRQVYQALNDRRALLPACRIGLLLADGRVSDGVRQVAETQNMRFLKNAVDPWAEAPAGRDFLPGIKPGDVLLLSARNPELSLNLVDLLQKRGFRLVAVSELARLDL